MNTEALTNVIREKGLSLQVVARKANMSPSDLSQILKGKKFCFKGWQKRIAQALDLPEEYFSDK